MDVERLARSPIGRLISIDGTDTRFNAGFRTGTSALGLGELEVELASVPPGDWGVGRKAGLAEDG